MSCRSLTQLIRNCTAKNLVAGAYKLYMIAFDNLQILPNTTEVYSINSSNVVTNIGVKSGKSFVEIGGIDRSVGLTEILNKNTTTNYLTQKVTLTLPELDSDNLNFAKTVLNQRVVIIVKTFDNSYWVIGLNGLCELAELNATIDSDNNLYNFVFEGIDKKLSLAIDPDNIVPIPPEPGADLEVLYELTNLTIGETEAIFSFA